MKIVTFNIRSCYDGWDGINSFIHRAGLVREVIAEKKPDIIGFQEVIPQIKTLLEVLLPEYQILGHGRLEDFGGEIGSFQIDFLHEVLPGEPLDVSYTTSDAITLVKGVGEDGERKFAC